MVVVSASVGGGHDAAANEIARRLTAEGHSVRTLDFIDMFPLRIGALLRRAYALELSVAPGSWGPLCSVLARRPVVALTAFLCTVLTGRRILRRTGSASAVLSTYPVAGQVLGRLRRQGRLDAQVLTYLTDVSVHPLWIAPGTDTYLAAHRVTAEQAGALGAGDVRHVDAAVRPMFRRADQLSVVAARQRFGLPASGRLALVVGGAWCVGDVAGTARDIAGTGLATPVVVCATNTDLHRELATAGTGIALGWVDDMATLMRACDVVVTNGGGVTSIEATEVGVPVVIYRELPGHGRTNAMAFDAAGLASWVHGLDGLATALAAPRAPRTDRTVKVDPAAVVAAATGPGHIDGRPGSGHRMPLPVRRAA